MYTMLREAHVPKKHVTPGTRPALAAGAGAATDQDGGGSGGRLSGQSQSGGATIT